MRGRSQTATGPLLILGAAVLWGTTGTAQEFAPDDTPASTVGLIRVAIGGIALVGAALIRKESIGPVFGPPLVVAAGAMAAYQPLFFGGVGKTGVAMGTIVAIGSAPVLAGLLAYAVRGERVAARWAGATALAVAGAALLVAGGEEIGVDTVGIVMALGAGAAYAVFAVAAKELLARHPAVAVMAAVFSGATVLLLPYGFVDDLSWVGTGRGMAVALHLGLVATAGAYLLFAAGLVRTSVATTATLTLGEPLTAALLGIVVLDETLSGRAWLGASMMLAGLVIASVALPRSRARTTDRVKA